MTEITMPRLSDSMEEGTIIRWLKGDGDAVKRGEELAEVETDKATMTYEADADGVLHLVASEGDALPVGAVIAHVLADGEAPPEPGAGNGAAASENGDATAPTAGEEGEAEPAAPAQRGGDAEPATAPAADARPTAAPAADAGPAVTPAADGARVKASPLARRLARELGVDLAGIAGSGPRGRIVKADVEQAAAQPAATVPTAASAPAPGGSGKGDVEVVALTSVQRTIARRMAEAKATMPEFQVRAEADVTELLALRKQLKGLHPDAPPSVNDFVVKACGLALREHPRANGAYKDATFELYGRVNVGVAVAGEGTLVVPTVFDADAKPVTQIARETRALAGKVREGTITPPELSGGTFTVSNLGMFGVTSFTAVINPGQAAILAVGAAVERVAVRAGELMPRSLMDLSLTCDHRILYGADAARFLERVCTLLASPLALLA
jgi:pyruvate dehydrogenase E2 component (dihydrolipoamide acetyltransferase)